MFQIEKLIKICETELPTLRFNVLTNDDGYRISIFNNGNEGNHRKERRIFRDIIRNIPNLHVIKVCEGHEYVLKILVILDNYYDKNNMFLSIETPSRELSFDNIYMSDYQHACEKFGIPESIELL